MTNIVPSSWFTIVVLDHRCWSIRILPWTIFQFMATFTIFEWSLGAFSQNGERGVEVLVSYHAGSSFPEQSYWGKDLTTGKESLSNNRAFRFQRWNNICFKLQGNCNFLITLCVSKSALYRLKSGLTTQHQTDCLTFHSEFRTEEGRGDSLGLDSGAQESLAIMWPPVEAGFLIT